MIIPPNTTDRIQPLDYGVFRIVKTFRRKFEHFLIIENIELNMKDRNNIMQFWSLLFNQLNSQIFNETLKNAWNCLTDECRKFENQRIDTIFDYSKIFCDICNDKTILKCTWCNKYLCLNHFYKLYHYHLDNSSLFVL